jgi:hypothetical protein
MEADFSGWATRANLKCRDGRTILPNAFQHQDKMQVPLVWAHGHNSPDNVLGHAILENHPEGVRAYGFFNETPQGQTAKQLVIHKDVDKLSIWANDLLEKAKQVMHGTIREVSLVLAGANPGAVIDQIRVSHGDGDVEELEGEAIIHTGLKLDGLNEGDSTSVAHDAQQGPGPTAQEVYDGLDEDQRALVEYLVQTAVETVLAQDDVADADPNSADAQEDAAAAHSANGKGVNSNKEGTGDMAPGTTAHNVFESQAGADGKPSKSLTHDAMQGIFKEALRLGSLKEAVHAYASANLEHGIDDIDVLFPNFRNATQEPDFIKRRTEWVAGVLNGVGHTPFSRVRSILADITQDEARAKGYIKGSMKKEEFFSVTKRTTSPATVYKKQKLDRDDILDITDFDVVNWMKGEMRLMLEEEVARAILIGDGRAVDDPDKIKDPAAATDGVGIRSILNEHEIYKTDVYVNIDDASSSYMEVIEAILRARADYKGTGTPTFYTTLAILTEMLLLKDTLGRRLYSNKAELVSALMVQDIVPVEAMEYESTTNGLLGILVNLQDYNVGTDKGGEINYFDFFDIDFNQLKYLYETRMSGALIKYKSALVVHKTAAGNTLVAPNAPTYNDVTWVVTIPSQTGVVYKNDDTGATLSSGAQTALTVGQTLNVRAVPATNYYFTETGLPTKWEFTRSS